MRTRTRTAFALLCLSLPAERAAAASFPGDLDTSHHSVLNHPLPDRLDAHPAGSPLASGLLAAFDGASDWAEAGAIGDYRILLQTHRPVGGRGGVAAVIADASTSVIGDLLTAAPIEWSQD